MGEQTDNSACARFIGIDSIVYGIEDMDLCHRFFDDWGLRTTKRTDEESILETRQGPSIVLRNLTASEFAFPAREPGSALREVVWGVESKRDLDIIAKELARDRAVERSADGSVHSLDPFGYGIGFKVWQHASVQATHNIDPGSTRVNFVGSRTRINEPAIHYSRAEPTRIGHVVFEISGPDDLARGEEFPSALPSVLTATPSPACSAAAPRKATITMSALLTTRNRQTQFERRLEVRHSRGVRRGLHFANTAGRPSWVGRHKVSSAYFWYFRSPAGGQVEYFSDTDFLDKS
jgi:hypothetical protein